MKIKFEQDTMPDDLYNALLLHFVKQAVSQGLPVEKHTQFVNWRVECELADTTHQVSLTKTVKIPQIFQCKIFAPDYIQVNICMENTNQISIADLDTIKNIIDLASSRGAFRGEELQEIGIVYNKLKNFLDAVIANAQAQQPFADSESEQPQGE